MPDVCHFHLPTRGAVRQVGEHAPLERLDQHALVDSADFDIRPIRLRYRVAEVGYPVDNLPFRDGIETSVVYWPGGVYEVQKTSGILWPSVGS